MSPALPEEQFLQLIPLIVFLLIMLLTLFALSSLIWGLRGAIHLTLLRQHGYRTVGDVIRVHAAPARTKTQYYTVPTVTFTAPDGRLITFKSVRLDNYRVGNRVDVIYLPGTPSIAEIPGASISSGPHPTYLQLMLYGGLSFPAFAYASFQILLKVIN
ncbi:DUF3592 domain-containing protein [Ktedonospora formicarum]|uniref:DUF3592 domain-containing protein n=1 Tax=Ktedonospora formicarum TaxID=2778364 RepID=A0A8J3I506_9CHLR|nr:DUF3592 domain-containing protein [Ktedonospora formicarum]GHO45514.1 hypothetical protein KSX_36770 [Ktedonospora formicarum]